MQLKKIVDADTFDQETNRKWLLVLFVSEACIPCHRTQILLEEWLDGLTCRYSQAEIAALAVDVLKVPEVAGRYAIGSIPQLLVLRDGSVLEVLPGVLTRQQLDGLEYQPFVEEEFEARDF
jgi:thioredoxin-like negative regulator of GroEL